MDLLGQSDGANTEYFAYDALGSVRQVTDDAGDPLLAQTYDPYGNLYVSAGTRETNLGFTGEFEDGNGLLFLRARYYQPGMGRFLNADPSRLERNPYQYSMGNPVMHTDPSGHYRLSYHIGGANTVPQQGGVAAHEQIEEWWMNSSGRTYAHVEYRIPIAGLYVDMVHQLTGEVWEIKPITAPTLAARDFVIKYAALNFAKIFANNRLAGVSTTGHPYDFMRLSAFVPGTSFSTVPQLIGVNTWATSPHLLYAFQPSPGTILYFYVKSNTKPQGVKSFSAPFISQWVLSSSQVPVPVAAPVPSGIPLPNPDWNSVPEEVIIIGGITIIVIGGTIVALTIGEDVATGGVGMIDDPITIGCGAYLIERGLALLQQLSPSLQPALPALQPVLPY